ncbi:hypothetical protein BLX41_02785 [Pseudomonas protegens]|uniref:hypothetical protein n=1 Tax=Pseudomonas protegens TaxID=380021 RepID=UPI000F4B315D|nr:hypothetical protein [Pseudomonas protegens]ROL82306.1 hypothetical protein BLX41_02785 [Pseudomonas protegens]
MKLRLIHGWTMVLMLVVLLLGGLTPVLSNSLLLLKDRANFIPAESSIWTFEPTLINQGSSSYWLYGEDWHYYFYFSYAEDQPYRLIAKNNPCPGFDRHDVGTWCIP